MQWKQFKMNCDTHTHNRGSLQCCICCVLHATCCGWLGSARLCAALVVLLSTRDAALQRAEGEKVTRVKAAEAEAEASYLQGLGISRQRQVRREIHSL